MIPTSAVRPPRGPRALRTAAFVVAVMAMVSAAGGASPDGAHRLRGCTADEIEQLRRNRDPGYASRRVGVERTTADWLAHRAAGGEGSRASTVIVPVVVHVLEDHAAGDLGDAQVRSRIASLNQDFRRTNADAASLPGALQSPAADTHVQFALAARDPRCGATTGITRTPTRVHAFRAAADDVKHDATGGHDAWPADRYLNLWIVPALLDEQGASLPGYATRPGTAADLDGVVIARSAWGTRAATHQIGHWLDLQHAGSDDDLDEGDGAPGAGSFMDPADDRRVPRFTAGQAARIDAALFGPRAALLSSNALIPPAAAGPDLYSQDRPDDTGAEPNALSGSLYESEDIWVRSDGDGLTHQEHQALRYRPGGRAHHVYVRVRNRGCADADSAIVKLYWARASTALAWPAPWDGSGGGPEQLGGLVGSAATGPVAAGQSTIVDFEWSPPTPAAPSAARLDGAPVCLLARIEGGAGADSGMTFPEGGDLGDNVRNNHRVVWKNVWVDDAGGARVASVLVGNPGDAPIEAKLVVRGPSDPADASVFEWGSVRVSLGPALFASWQSAGARAKAARVEGREVVLGSPGATISGLHFAPHELRPIELRFEPAPGRRQRGSAAFKLALEELVVDATGDHLLGGQLFVLKAVDAPSLPPAAPSPRFAGGCSGIDRTRGAALVLVLLFLWVVTWIRRK